MISDFPDWRPGRDLAAGPLPLAMVKALPVLIRNLLSEVAAGAAVVRRHDRYGQVARWILVGAVVASTVHTVLMIGLGLENAVAHTLWHLGIFRLDRDGSIPEFFEYGLTLLAAYTMWRAATFCNSSLLRMVAVTHAYLFADNAFNWHEKAGRNLPFESKVDGEAVYMIGVAVIVAVLLIYGFVKDRGRLTGIALVNGCYFVAMAIFAIATDFVHSLYVDHSFAVNHLLTILEDGGEITVMVLLGVYSLSILARLPAAGASDGSSKRT
ncbi:MAG: hypothetical protein AAGF76_16240 [Pseudomonadota bacterium]